MVTPELLVSERSISQLDAKQQFGVIFFQAETTVEIFPGLRAADDGAKAQAVAARTYAFRNLKQFESEGYDICPGPACQAYKGFSVEHELSTRAVRETAGLIVTSGGQAVDTL